MKTPGESSSWGGGGGGGQSDKHFPCGREMVSIVAHTPTPPPSAPDGTGEFRRCSGRPHLEGLYLEERKGEGRS